MWPNCWKAKKGDEILVEPKSGQGIRDMAKLTFAVAEANPNIKVGFDFSGNYYAVKPQRDSVTEIVIRYYEEPGIGRSKPGRYHDIARARPEALETSVSDKEGFTKLFDVLIDAIRLARHNGGKAVEFAFNKHRMVVFPETTPRSWNAWCRSRTASPISANRCPKARCRPSRKRKSADLPSRARQA